MTLDDVSDVRFEGLAFDLAQHDGIIIRGGARCLLAGCTISRLAGGGVNIDGGRGHGLHSCDLFTLGRNGTWVKGGDRTTLTPGAHFVENCHIHDFSRLDRTYTPAVWTPGWSENNAFWQLFAAGKSPEWTEFIMSELYLARYPLLRDLRDKRPLNFVWRNVLWNCGERYRMHENHVDTQDIAVYADANPGFVDPAHGDFRPRPNATALQENGFRPLPVEEIGLYPDDYRATWPVTSAPMNVPDWRVPSPRP